MFLLSLKVFFSKNKFWLTHSMWGWTISFIYSHGYIAQSLFDELYPRHHCVQSFRRSDLVINISLTLQWVNCEVLLLYSLNLESPTLMDINWYGVCIYLMGKEAFGASLTHRSDALTPMILSFIHAKCIVYYTFSGCDHSDCASYSTNHARVTCVTLKRWWQSRRSSTGLMLTSNAAAAVWDAGLQGGVSKGLLRFYSSFFAAVSIMNWQISVSFYVIVYFGAVFLPGSASCADYPSILENKDRMNSRSVWHLLRNLMFA